MAGDGFCPKCGALMYNGACVSCGYGKSKKQESDVEKFSIQAGTGGRFSGNSDSAHSAKQGAAGGKNSFPMWMIVLVVIGFFFLLTLVLIGVATSQVMDKVMDFSAVVEVAPEPDALYDYNGDGTISDLEYVPSPSDKYLEAIVSSTVRGLSYEIAWNDTYLYADDEANEAAFYCYYPFIIGSDADYVAEMNAEISQMAMSYMPTTLSENDYGYVDGYVTYMSEEVLSVVILYYYDHAGEEEYRISALNYDMSTGEKLSIQEMLPEYEFMIGFRSSCEEQNGYTSSAVLETMTDDEILKTITDPESGVAFYSPVGVDIGFNYPDGWLTVTLKQEYY